MAPARTDARTGAKPGGGSSPRSLSRSPALGATLGRRLPDAVLHGKWSYRPRSRAVRCLSVAGFRVRPLSPLRPVVAPPDGGPGPDTAVSVFRVWTGWHRDGPRDWRGVGPVGRVWPLTSQAATHPRGDCDRSRRETGLDHGPGSERFLIAPGRAVPRSPGGDVRPPPEELVNTARASGDSKRRARGSGPPAGPIFPRSPGIIPRWCHGLRPPQPPPFFQGTIPFYHVFPDRQ